MLTPSPIGLCPVMKYEQINAERDRGLLTFIDSETILNKQSVQKDLTMYIWYTRDVESEAFYHKLLLKKQESLLL